MSEYFSGSVCNACPGKGPRRHPPNGTAPCASCIDHGYTFRARLVPPKISPRCKRQPWQTLQCLLPVSQCSVGKHTILRTHRSTWLSLSQEDRRHTPPFQTTAALPMLQVPLFWPSLSLSGIERKVASSLQGTAQCRASTIGCSVCIAFNLPMLHAPLFWPSLSPSGTG